MHLARLHDGELSARDVIEHWLARRAGEPLRARLAQLRVDRGRVMFADHAGDRDRQWIVRDLSVDARDIVTVADAETGRLTATFVVAGAPGTLEIAELRARPFHARASLRLDGLDVAPFSVYLPMNATLQLAGGRFSPRVTVEYDARGFLRAGGESMIRDLVIARPGRAPALVTVPLLRLRASDATYAGGAWTVAEVALAAERATVLDACGRLFESCCEGIDDSFEGPPAQRGK